MDANRGTSISRELGIEEIRRLVAASETAKKQHEDSRYASHAWPGAYNLRLLAEAVSNRRTFVEFEPNNKRFKIRYESRYEAVFIKPADGGFVPCGYFSYSKLKESLEDEVA